MTSFKWVSVTIRIPEPVLDFVTAMQQLTGRDPTEYMATAIRDIVLTDVEELQASMKIRSSKTPDLKHKYRLDTVDIDFESIWPPEKSQEASSE